jgi:type IV secretion system protein VirD4
LWSLGEKKTALFAIIPDNDTSFNFLVSILYTQLFQQLFELADKKYGGSLPVHVQFICDEFANSATRSTLKTVGITDKSVA